MPGRWDTSTKRLVNTRPEDFIRWLIPGAEFIGPVEAKSLNLNNQEQVVEKAISALEITDDEDKRDLLSLTYIFAAMAFVKETDRHWLQRRFRMFEDALKNSWAYQEIWQGGKQEGIEQGKLEERLADVQRQRYMLEYLVEQDFPALLPLAKKRGEVSDDPDVLQEIILRLLRVGSEQEARQILSQEG